MVRVPGRGCGMEGISVCLGHVPSVMSNIKVSLNGENVTNRGPLAFVG